MEHDGDPPRLDWSEFRAGFRWRQGEHVSLIGPTGGGKTTLALAILDQRAYVTVMASKPKDARLDRLRREGFIRIREWPGPPLDCGGDRLLLWPRMRRTEDMRQQQAVFDHALRSIFKAGNWCIYADELRYLGGTLGLRSHFELLWLQGRSLGISLVAGTQRPAWVPVEMYSQATHLFFWRDNDDANLKRIAGMGGLSAKVIKDVVARLPKHDVLYVNTRDGEMAITRVERNP